jgi:hypothetical protein
VETFGVPLAPASCGAPLAPLPMAPMGLPFDEVNLNAWP